MIINIYNDAERSKFYKGLLQTYSTQVGAPIWFKFTDFFTGEGLMPNSRVDGEATWEDAAYLIQVRRNLKPAAELKTLAHELAHLLDGHVLQVKKSPAQIHAGDVLYSQWANRTAPPSHAQKVQTQETGADALAAKLLKDWKNAGITAY